MDDVITMIIQSLPSMTLLSLADAPQSAASDKLPAFSWAAFIQLVPNFKVFF